MSVGTGKKKVVLGVLTKLKDTFKGEGRKKKTRKEKHISLIGTQASHETLLTKGDPGLAQTKKGGEGGKKIFHTKSTRFGGGELRR